MEGKRDLEWRGRLKVKPEKEMTKQLIFIKTRKLMKTIMRNLTIRTLPIQMRITIMNKKMDMDLEVIMETNTDKVLEMKTMMAVMEDLIFPMLPNKTRMTIMNKMMDGDQEVSMEMDMDQV